MFVKSGLAALLPAMLVGVAMAAPMDSCGTQADCIVWTIEEKTGADATAECGDCEFTVCARLDLDDPNDPNDNQCVKSATDTVSHTCVWPDDQCPETVGTSTEEVKDVPDGNTQCQTGAAGQTLTFLFKDGGGCDDTDETGGVGYPVGGIDGVSATCSKTTELYCTGEGNLGKECLWSVELPACSGEPPAPPPPTGNCPKGRGVCYTPDCACVLGNCNPSSPGDDFLLLDSNGVPLADGTYNIPEYCESGKALSNAVTIGEADVCVKDEPGTALTYDIAGGVLATPLSMKCGKDCFLYGGFVVVCN